MTGGQAVTLRERLHALAAFLPAMQSPDFQFGSWHPSYEQKPGVFTFPYYSFGDVVITLHTVVYEKRWVLPEFEWSAWKGTEEALALRDEPARLANATPDQLTRLLTVLFRQDRFCEGSLAAAYESGLLVRILRRASTLETEMIEKESA